MKKKVFRERNKEVEFEIPKEEHKEIVKEIKEILKTSEVIAEGEIKPKRRKRSVKSSK